MRLNKNVKSKNKRILPTFESMKNKQSADPDKFPFFETIRIAGGLVEHADLHLDRMQKTCLFHYNEFHFGKIIDDLEISGNGLFKLNIWYNQHETEIRLSEYVPAAITKIKIVECEPDFDYSWKYTDRQYLNNLLQSASGADEIILVKSGFVTDTSKANIVFEKNGKLYTPETFLLNGTMRQYLLKTGQIIEKRIRTEDIQSYEKMYFINAMNPMETALVAECLSEMKL